MDKEASVAIVQDLGATRSGKNRILIKYFIGGYSGSPSVLRLIESFQNIFVEDNLTLVLPFGTFDFRVTERTVGTIRDITNSSYSFAKLELEKLNKKESVGKNDVLYVPVKEEPQGVSIIKEGWNERV